MIKAFPKIFAVGTRYVDSIFEDEVEVSEKIDGSQMVFRKLNGELFIRSKGQQIRPEVPEKLFLEGINYILSIQNILPNNTVFYCEYLKKPKHNVLCYDRIPENHLILFGVANEKEIFNENLEEWATLLGIESVPILFRGKINSPDELKALLQKISVLGTVKIEGVVVKNYKKTVYVGDQVLPLMSAKYVSEEFKEVHMKDWSKDNTDKGKFEKFVESLRTEARWLKAVQHLAEVGQLDNSPKDIGNLMKEIREDITAEEKDRILEFLWNNFSRQILSNATRGLPEWYKEKLMKESFNVTTPNNT